MACAAVAWGWTIARDAWLQPAGVIYEQLQLWHVARVNDGATHRTRVPAAGETVCGTATRGRDT